MTRPATIIFDHVHPHNFWSALNFCKSVSTCKKLAIPSQKVGSLNILIGTLAASLLRNLLAGKGLVGAGEGTIRVG